MAKITTSQIINSISGKLGSLLFKNTKHGPTVSRKPNPHPSQNLTTKNKQTIFSQTKNLWTPLSQAKKRAWTNLALSLKNNPYNPSTTKPNAYNLFTQYIALIQAQQQDPEQIPVPSPPAPLPNPSITWAISPKSIIQNIKQLTDQEQAGLKATILRHGSASKTYRSAMQISTNYTLTKEKSINWAQSTPEKTIPHQPNELLTIETTYHRQNQLPGRPYSRIIKALNGTLLLEDFEQYPFTEWSYNSGVCSQSSEKKFTGSYSLRWQFYAGTPTQIPFSLSSNTLPYPVPPITVHFYTLAQQNPRAILAIPTYTNSQNYPYLLWAFNTNLIQIVEYRNGTPTPLIQKTWTDHPLDTWLDLFYTLEPDGTITIGAQKTGSPYPTTATAKIQTMQNYQLHIIPTNLGGYTTTYFFDTITLESH